MLPSTTYQILITPYLRGIPPFPQWITSVESDPKSSPALRISSLWETPLLTSPGHLCKVKRKILTIRIFNPSLSSSWCHPCGEIPPNLSPIAFLLGWENNHPSREGERTPALPPFLAKNKTW
ncbi:hypothetical protein PGB90_008661 [Kerria lacca]